MTKDVAIPDTPVLKKQREAWKGFNPSGPPPGVDALATIGDEAPGQVAAYESNYRVGAPVVHEILANWSRFEISTPGK